MKAKELLRRYAAGKRDFQGSSLRGQNFKGHVLSEADFSYADIRGANFSNAILRGANFTGAKAGIQRRWIGIQCVVSFLISLILNYASFGLNGFWMSFFFGDYPSDHQRPFDINLRIIGFLILGLFICVWTLVLYQGLTKNTFIEVAILVAVTGVISGLNSSLYLTSIDGFAGPGWIVVLVITGVAALISLSFFGSVCLVMATFRSTAFLGALATPLVVLAFNNYRTVGRLLDFSVNNRQVIGHLSVHLIVVLITSFYIAWQASKGNRKFTFVYEAGLSFNSIGGTSFRCSNLTKASFVGAHLRSASFHQATMTGINWKNAKQIHRVRWGETYLLNPAVQSLIVSRNGQNQNFDGLNLEGANLEGVNLQDSSFIGTSLNQSNLRGADLSRVVLKQTQLDGADLTGAILTGAYIEDWGITSTTNMENVQCEYVYMRVPTKENPNPLRKPDNLRETFAEGEFADFIQPFFDTLDLYHSQNVDPRAVSIALKKLSQNHPEADLEIVAMEKRGQNSLNLKVRTAPTSDKSELSSEYFADYNQLRALSEARLLLLTEKDDRIRRLEQMIQTALHQPTFNVETVQGDFMPEHRGININAGDNANISGVSSGDGIVNLGEISGNVTNAINQLPESSEPEQVSIKTLLTQLQRAIESDADLSTPDKSDLLEQVKSLTEAKQSEEPEKREGIVRKAMKMFDATLKSLPDTAKIVEACSKLLPLILKPEFLTSYRERLKK
jgi:uncharacterized protein YjbI with pentapeptide repeats